MNILQVINVRWYNATSWYGLTLSKLLKEQGHEVCVLTLKDTESHAKALEMDLPCITLPLNTTNPLRILPLLKKMRDIIQEYKPHIVNCHRGESFVFWGLFKVFGAPYKLVRTRGDQRMPKTNVFNRLLHKKVSDSVVVTNSGMKRHFIDNMGVREQNIHCIPGGVDRNFFQFDPEGRKRIRKEFNYTDQDFVLGVLGRLDRVKGHKEVLQSAARLLEKGTLPNIKLLFIGFDTALSTDDIFQLAREYNVDHILTITGTRKDIPSCISSCDLGIISSLGSEAIARAGLEFMSCSIPLIGTNVGVMPDLCPEEALFPPGDVQAMATCIETYWQNPSLRTDLVRNQKQTIDQLSLQNFLHETLSLYHSLLSR